MQRAGKDSVSRAHDRWAAYVARYHAGNPGITETAFEHARDGALGTPHDWLAAALPGPVGAVLDLACGSAPMFDRLQHDSYLGLDLSTAELALARARGRGPVGLADARWLPLPDSCVDTVVCSMGLMLVQPVDDAVREVARVLRPGGRFALLLPALGPIAPRDVRPTAALAAALRGPGSMPQRLGGRRLKAALGHAGLTVQAMHRHRFPFPLTSPDDVRLAVSALYTPGRTARQLRKAEERLARYVTDRAELGLPLLRLVAERADRARVVTMRP